MIKWDVFPVPYSLCDSTQILRRGLLQPCCGNGMRNGEIHDRGLPRKEALTLPRPGPGMWVVTHLPLTLREDNFKAQRSLGYPTPTCPRQSMSNHSLIPNFLMCAVRRVKPNLCPSRYTGAHSVFLSRGTRPLSLLPCHPHCPPCGLVSVMIALKAGTKEVQVGWLERGSLAGSL